MPKHPARSWSGVAGPRATAAAATVAAAVFVAPAAYSAAITPAVSTDTVATHSTVPAALAGPALLAAAGPTLPAPTGPILPASAVPTGAAESMRAAVLANTRPRTLETLLAPPAPVALPAPTQVPAPAQVPAPVIGVTKGAVALAAAMSVRGTPYRWGAAGKGGFDCSGLALWAYRRAGVSLPHSSRGQSGIGTAVSRADLRPGDLVFFYRPVSHVGIYLGNGNVVHAPQSGDVVKVSPLARMPFSGARRL